MTQSAYIPFGGGIDLVSPPREMKPGSCFYAVNYECPVTGGYRRVDGYTQIGSTLPGTGAVLGVKTFNDKQYAIRAKDSDTASLYVFDGDSWTPVDGGDGTLTVGRYEFIEGNLYATDSKHALYFVGGGEPWELSVDGTLTKLDNAPTGAQFIAIHQNHIILGFEPGSLMFSGVGEPNQWDASTDGAGEIGVGSAITGLISGRGDVLHVGCDNSMQGLYGTSSQNFQMKTTLPASGCKRYSLQSMMEPYFVGERTITSLKASSDFGDFTPFQAGAKIEPLFTEEGYAGRITASMVSKQRAQYRVFFDDKTGVFYSPTGATTIEFLHQVMATDTAELDSGEEFMMFGDDEGNVFRLGAGAESFAGEAIRAFVTTAYTDLKSTQTVKRFRRAFLDINNSGGSKISVKANLDYGGVGAPNHNRYFIDYMPKGGLWSVDKWDEFAWSSPMMASEPIAITGSGQSINFAIYSDEISPSHSIYGYTINFDPRRLRRG